ncbi:uracil-DNA glycosylase [Gordonia sp. i37]|uniref:uracil-DNA glycosylase n=1 Tax=Gordonia sp. i37 TaxID=1961707 RepID=UPI0009AD21ED|nr:uracil-DNA glycosylase [Gordonia sp. i37]OPX15572.1 hypothetical protein B1964_09250 [Gordonia sp. i37]
MADARYRREQAGGVYLPHVEPINRLVDELRTDEEWMPYVAPAMGGINARLLVIFRDPGPKTRDGQGSGMLSPENDDPSAERLITLLTDAGIDVEEVMGWNTFPWYINRKPSSPEVDRGLPVLRRVVELCPNLKVVMAHGGDAQVAWKRFRRRYSADARGLTTIETYHTSRQALWTPDPAIREQREQHLRDSFAEAADALRA